MRFAAKAGADRRGRAAGFFRDEGGASALMFTLSLPVVLLAIAVAIDYTNASRFKTRIQAAADAASLAATEAVAQNPNAANLSLDQVTQIAQPIADAFFTANAPPGASGQPTVTPSYYNSTVTVEVGYQGTAPSNFGALLGYSGFTANTSSTAQAVVGEKSGSGSGSGSVSSVGATHYSGYGVIGGDPHVYGFNNNDYYVACTQPGQTTWINVLSDSGIEINASCVYNTYFAMDSLQTVTILLGSHVITTTAALPQVPYEGGPITYNAATAWFGQVTIDGVTYPAIKGTRTLLNQAVTGGALTVIQYVHRHDKLLLRRQRDLHQHAGLQDHPILSGSRDGGSLDHRDQRRRLRRSRRCARRDACRRRRRDQRRLHRQRRDRHDLPVRLVGLSDAGQQRRGLGRAPDQVRPGEVRRCSLVPTPCAS